MRMCYEQAIAQKESLFFEFGSKNSLSETLPSKCRSKYCCCRTFCSEKEHIWRNMDGAEAKWEVNALKTQISVDGLGQMLGSRLPRLLIATLNAQKTVHSNTRIQSSRFQGTSHTPAYTLTGESIPSGENVKQTLYLTVPGMSSHYSKK